MNSQTIVQLCLLTYICISLAFGWIIWKTGRDNARREFASSGWKISIHKEGKPTYYAANQSYQQCINLVEETAKMLYCKVYNEKELYTVPSFTTAQEGIWYIFKETSIKIWKEGGK